MDKKYNFYNEMMIDESIKEASQGGGGGGGDVTKEYVDTQDQALSNRITTNSNNINTLSTRANQLQTDVNDLGNNVSTLQTTVTNFDTTKANKSEVYTKTETDTLVNNKADKSTTYTKTETDNLLANKLSATGADRGLNITSNKVGHTNSITAGTKGSTIAIPKITYDAQGHITEVAEQTVYPPTTAGTNGQYWKSDGSGQGVWTTPSTSITSASTDVQIPSAKAVYTAIKIEQFTGNNAMTISNPSSLTNGADYADNVKRRIIKVGNMVYFSCHLKYTSAAAGKSWLTIGTIASAFKPSYNRPTICGMIYNNGENEACGGNIDTDGTIQIWTNDRIAGNNYQIRITACWSIA